MDNRTILPRLHRKFILPRSTDPDARRREYILNVLLSGLGLVSVISLLNSLAQLVYLDSISYVESFVMVPAVTVFLAVLLWLSRKGYSRYIAGVLITFFLALATFSLLSWGVLLPMTQLLYAFCIVLAGVLFRARAAIFTALVSSLLFSSIGAAQLEGSLTPDISWLATDPNKVDILGGVLIFIIIGLVTWLANTEIDRALARARSSEASLAEERDKLEIRVKERTRELEEEHLIRIMELQRFAALGKMSASILHDIANPLTVASLNIEQMNSSYEPSLVKQTEQSLHHIERYVENARKQLVASSTVTTFSVNKETKQVISILSHRAKERQVSIKIDIPKNLKLTGDPVKFSQLLANLVMNAVEAYETHDTPEQKIVLIVATRYRKGVSISVHDKGKGIPPRKKSQIFQPFYTTKSHDDRNKGAGKLCLKCAVRL